MRYVWRPSIAETKIKAGTANIESTIVKGYIFNVSPKLVMPWGLLLLIIMTTIMNIVTIKMRRDNKKR